MRDTSALPPTQSIGVQRSTSPFFCRFTAIYAPAHIFTLWQVPAFDWDYS